MTASWNVILTDEAREDYRRLDGGVKRRVTNVIYRVSKNPLVVVIRDGIYVAAD